VCERRRQEARGLVDRVLDVVTAVYFSMANSDAFVGYSPVPAIAACLLDQCCIISSSNLTSTPLTMSGSSSSNRYF
jgi:hypothetical protein